MGKVVATPTSRLEGWPPKLMLTNPRLAGGGCVCARASAAAAAISIAITNVLVIGILSLLLIQLVVIGSVPPAMVPRNMHGDRAGVPPSRPCRSPHTARLNAAWPRQYDERLMNGAGRDESNGDGRARIWRPLVLYIVLTVVLAYPLSIHPAGRLL